ncbi:hypothetical protein CSB11_01635 [Candidatus Campbellbacteria bacterium]|nr:MAG: hypothetical protein CSB11_01635 [Candidatus Campbellbacteria bacterium]
MNNFKKGLAITLIIAVMGSLIGCSSANQRIHEIQTLNSKTSTIANKQAMVESNLTQIKNSCNGCSMGTLRNTHRANQISAAVNAAIGEKIAEKANDL